MHHSTQTTPYTVHTDARPLVLMRIIHDRKQKLEHVPLPPSLYLRIETRLENHYKPKSAPRLAHPRQRLPSRVMSHQGLHTRSHARVPPYYALLTKFSALNNRHGCCVAWHVLTCKGFYKNRMLPPLSFTSRGRQRQTPAEAHLKFASTVQTTSALAPQPKRAL